LNVHKLHRDVRSETTLEKMGTVELVLPVYGQPKKQNDRSAIIHP